ncbi:hypothetical protein DI09_165p20 [Mitosporidium daphniae]|uniref:Uncharacterized protein n=1 Tax=Mitosporidium daphniae TaxID=1485682 RepID=A0A098VTS5_9MICR|nr:uncharacterized protein DI09_165p20 [Mitosporidium daphniae]KGG52508.1 hypothetical protein DI09_165p20 [Mitosporidium daphniae]|eukprot:XP_013238944.1 uncharacterized protein DI09_165p20 [Mitosporidium daphniae]
MPFPVEDLLPIAPKIIPLLVERDENLVSSDALEDLSDILPQNMYLLIKKIVEDKTFAIDKDNGAFEDLYEAFACQDYGLLIQKASKLDILFATLIAKMLLASGHLLGLEKVYVPDFVTLFRNGISIIDGLLFQCIRSLTSSASPLAWPWAFTLVPEMSDPKLVGSAIQVLREFLEKLLTFSDASFIPILLPLVFHVDRTTNKKAYPLLSLVLEVYLHFHFVGPRPLEEWEFNPSCVDNALKSST